MSEQVCINIPFSLRRHNQHWQRTKSEAIPFVIVEKKSSRFTVHYDLWNLGAELAPQNAKFLWENFPVWRPSNDHDGSWYAYPPGPTLGEFYFKTREEAETAARAIYVVIHGGLRPIGSGFTIQEEYDFRKWGRNPSDPSKVAK